ncbi:hypothetical protein [Actinopolymorpha alba]|nr:hypothetical protein [Actinopolymorpha alba]
MRERTPGNGSSSQLADVELIEAAGHSISAGHGGMGQPATSRS